MYTFVAEFFALVILAVIIASAGMGGHMKTKSKRYFKIAVISNAVFILLDGLSIWGCRQGPLFAPWFHYTVLTLYWFACFVMVYAYTLYILNCMKDRIGTRPAFDTAARIAALSLLSSCAVAITNLFTHHMFYLDSSLYYCHGPLWAIGYFQLGIAISVVSFCSIRFRAEIGGALKRIQIIGLPVIVLLFVFQALYPSIVMIGVAGTCFALVVLLVLQRNSIETDHLTGLGNQFDFLAQRHTWEKQGNPDRIFVVSLDHLQSVNTTYGSIEGDRLLRKVAEWACENCLRDNTYRISPASFALVYPHCPTGEGNQTFASMQRDIPQSLSVNGKKLPLSVSYIDYAVHDHANPDLVLERIEYAHVKMSGLEMMAFQVDDEVAEEFESKKRLTVYLEHSVRERRFLAYVQPVYDVHTNMLLSGEILCRLQGPDNSIISPEHFIPVAEESRLVADIGWLTLEDVCWFLSKRDDERLSRVSVNLSMQQLMDIGFVERLERLLKTYGIERGRLALEVTERMLVSRDARVENSIARLRDLGYTFLMDDFGTGYSNLETMMNFPFDKIKVDKSIVDLACKDNYESLQTLIRLIHHNGFEAVVEGVETEEQASRIISCGADYLQGFLYARPMPLEDYADFLSSWQLPFGAVRTYA